MKQANKVIKSLSKKVKPVRVYAAKSKKGTVYRIRLGYFKTKSDVDNLRKLASDRKQWAMTFGLGGSDKNTETI